MTAYIYIFALAKKMMNSKTTKVEMEISRIYTHFWACESIMFYVFNEIIISKRFISGTFY